MEWRVGFDARAWSLARARSSIALWAEAQGPRRSLSIAEVLSCLSLASCSSPVLPSNSFSHPRPPERRPPGPFRSKTPSSPPDGDVVFQPRKIERDLLDYDLPALLGAATGVAATRSTVTDVEP